MKIGNNEALEIMPVRNLSELTQAQLESVVATYQTAFAEPPYEEAFADEEVVGVLQYIFDKNGDLVIGRAEDSIVSLCGGYMQDSNVYYIEELAVRPDQQGVGLGRRTLRALIEKALIREPTGLELRTTGRNDRALSLYGTEGFVSKGVSEVVAQKRQDGRLTTDERVYLFKPLKEEIMKDRTTLKRVAIVYPSGNTTAVVFDQMLDVDREELNRQVMESWKRQALGQPEIEQCCFVTLPKDQLAVARVEMFGGEFCGNATRSVIQLVTEGNDYEGMIEVSGVDRPLNFNVKDGVIAVEMPLSQAGNLTKAVDEGVLVQLDGIIQLVVTDTEKQAKRSPRELLEDLLTQNKYDLASQPAVGITYYDPISTKAEFGVWVKEVNTIFDETACGSGTCAVGITAALQAQQDQRLEVIQPSGESIVTEAAFDSDKGKVITSTIAGVVSVLYDGKVALS